MSFKPVNDKSGKKIVIYDQNIQQESTKNYLSNDGTAKIQQSSIERIPYSNKITFEAPKTYTPSFV